MKCFFFVFFLSEWRGLCRRAAESLRGIKGMGVGGREAKKGMEGMKIGLWGVWGDAALHHPVHLPVLYQQIGLHELEAVL